MSSVTLPRRIRNINFIDKNSNNINDEKRKNIVVGSYPSDNYEHHFQRSTTNQMMKSTRALSCNEEKIQLQSNNNNRIKHLCTRFIRRLSISRKHRTRSEDRSRGLSIRFNNYKSFSSSTDDSYYDFEWPDFEKIYDSIPYCLAKALPGFDDLSNGENDDDDNNDNNDDNDSIDDIIDETNEQINLFENCERGKYFRRNAICHKLDKSQYHRQWNTFVQQLMIEKLMRTWT
ncbi:unnamed protein product [Rotaria sp. Silwood1]|nr:unnamed protein product [Rotaria sp. Silwood1]CAF4820247.1 unnamed protein product [Rotaria sp. Silwood1]